MRKFWLSIIIVFFSTSLASIASAANPKYGDPCPKLNQVKTYDYITFLCLKVNGKLVWTGKQYGDPQSDKKRNVGAKKQPTPKIDVRKEGGGCSELGKKLKLGDGALYCVKVMGGELKYIKVFDNAPAITNPSTPFNISDCRPPDLRGGVPNGWDRGAITYPVINHALVNSGILNLAVVPIDFQDFQGTGLPSTIYKSEMERMQNWFNFFSNGKLKIEYQVDDKWHRAPNKVNHYNVGEGVDISPDGFSTKQLVNEYVEVTKSNFDFSKADAVLFVYPPDLYAIQKPITRYGSITLNGVDKGMMLMATPNSPLSFSRLSVWTAHEMLHHMGLVQHFPVNPPDWGIEWGGSTRSEVLLPWNQSILDWINPDQYYCTTRDSLSKTRITLTPLEKSMAGMRAIDRKSTRLNSSHTDISRMPSSA